MSEMGFPSDAEFLRARRAVERGWVSKEQVEAAVAACDRDPGSRLLSHLPLTPDQLRELDGVAEETIQAPTSAPHRGIPPEVAEALKDPKRRVGRFVLVNLLGKGGMGMVFRGWEPELRQWVALKFLKQIGDDTARAYFKREAQLAAGLDHPNIAKIYEIAEHDGPAFAPVGGASAGKQPFIAMQYVDGAPLSAKDLKLEEKIRIVRAIAEAVKYAHAKNVVHRDLKPANVMIDKNGQVYVMDFGLAKETAVEGESLGGSSLVVGTPSYMAPEQAKGKADAQSDVYGIGAILYELVTGRPPFTGETSTDVIMQVVTQEPVWPRKLSPTTPEDVEAIVLHALEKEPKRRYESAARLIEDLEAFAQKNPLRHARRPTFAYVLEKNIRKQPLLWTFAAMMVAGVLGGSAFGTWQLLRARTAAVQKLEAERKGRRETEAQRDRAERGERAAQEARDEALNKADSLIVEQAAAALERDPTRSLATLKLLSPETRQLGIARLIALQARSLAVSSLLVGHTAPVRSVAWSPDSRLLASCGEDDSVRLWGIDDGTCRTLAAHTGYVVHVAWSPDGRFLASAGWDRTARVWDISTGENRASIIHQNYVSRVAWSPDGRSLASASWDGTVRLYDVESKSDRLLYRHAGKLTDVAWSSDGRWVASSSDDGSVAVFDLRAGSARMLTGHGNVVSCLAWSPVGLSLASGSWDETILIWNVESGTSRVLKGHSGHVLHVVWSADGTRLSSAGADGSVRGWELDSGKNGPLIQHAGAVWRLAWSKDRRRIVSAGDDKLVKMWESDTGPARVVSGHDAAVVDVAWSPDGKRLASAGSDKMVRVWQADSGACRTFTGPECRIDCIAWAADSRRLACGAGAKLVAWEVASGERQVIDVSRESGWWFDCLSWSPDGRFVAGTRGEKERTELHVWDGSSDTGRRFVGHRDKILSIAWSPDGRALASAGYDRDIRVWDAASGESRVFAGHHDLVTCVAWSPDGRSLASLSDGSDKSVRLWDASSGSGRIVAGHAGGADVVVWSPGGETLAWSDQKKSVWLWNVHAETLREFKGHGDSVRSLSWSRDGGWLASASHDKTVRIWNGETGECRILGGHDGKVFDAQWSPDGRMLATRCEDANVWIWDVASGQRRLLAGHPWQIKQTAWSPDGKALASLDFTGSEIRLWLMDVPSEPAEFFAWLGRATNAIIADDRSLTSAASAVDSKASSRPVEPKPDDAVAKKLAAQAESTRAGLQVVSQALDVFQLDVGRLPSTEEGLAALLEEPSAVGNSGRWRGPYLAANEVPRDAWGNALIYRMPGRVHAAAYDLFSKGPDGIEGTPDDVWWKR